jgi:hypothetical protein
MSSAYHSISVAENDDVDPMEGIVGDDVKDNNGYPSMLLAAASSRIGRRHAMPALVVLGLGSIFAYLAHDRSSSTTTTEGGGVVGIDGDDASPPLLLPPLPTGVNLASWFSLEDWFFVGRDGAVEVATPDDSIAASCLPPLHLDESTGPRWNSETDLLAGLADHYTNAENDNATDKEGGGSLGGWGKAIRAMHAFRTSYYDMDDELRTMNRLGIKYVRVPVSWCWTDYDPTWLIYTNEYTGETVYTSDDDVKQKFACEDPFYPGVYWPAIPRGFFVRFLRKCAEYGIGATIDLHTYPGGTSIGTFSGVWPKYSRFWTHGDVPATDDGKSPDVGRTLLRDFIKWMESLETTDPMAFRG